MAASKPSYESLKSKITNYTQKMTKFQMNSQRKIARSGDKLRKHSERQNGPGNRVLFNELFLNFSIIITQSCCKKLISKPTHCRVEIFNNHSSFSITKQSHNAFALRCNWIVHFPSCNPIHEYSSAASALWGELGWEFGEKVATAANQNPGKVNL